MPSPIVSKTLEEMSFPQAIEHIVLGEKMTRLDWMDLGTYIFLRDGFLSLKNSEGIHRLLVSDADMLANDWVIVNGFVNPDSGQKRTISGANN